jgi:hypothetical protein
MKVSNNKLTDFIYLDIDRIRSFIAQLYQGVPEAFEETKGQEKSGKGEIGIAAPLLGKAGIGGSILYQKSTAETRSAHHYLYSLLEQKLNESGKVLKVDSNFPKDNWNQDRFKDGTFILVQGKIQIIDYRNVVSVLQMIPRMMEISSIFQKQKLRQQLQKNEIDQRTYDRLIKSAGTTPIDKKDLKNVSEVVEKIYYGIARVKAFPFLDDEPLRFVGNAIYEYFSTSPNNPLSSGILSGTNWYMMGLINEPITYSTIPPSESEQKNFEDSLEAVVLSMQEINKQTLSVKFPSIPITPIAIYRQC